LRRFWERKRMQNYAVDLLIRMVKVHSPSGKEEHLAGLLSDEMKQLGFEVERDRVGNVTGRLAGDRPWVMLCGHMDTVPGIIPVRVEDGIIYGRGAVDAKASLAAMINAAAQLAEEGYKAGILVVAAVGEEDKGQGMKYLVKKGIDVDSRGASTSRSLARPRPATPRPHGSSRMPWRRPSRSGSSSKTTGCRRKNLKAASTPFPHA